MTPEQEAKYLRALIEACVKARGIPGNDFDLIFEADRARITLGDCEYEVSYPWSRPRDCEWELTTFEIGVTEAQDKYLEEQQLLKLADTALSKLTPEERKALKSQSWKL